MGNYDKEERKFQKNQKNNPRDARDVRREKLREAIVTAVREMWPDRDNASAALAAAAERRKVRP